jgi:hypothetical protein
LNNNLKQKELEIEQLKLEDAQMKEKLASLEAKLNRLLLLELCLYRSFSLYCFLCKVTPI